uniref:RING-type domain-containing protein n=1 Tax=Panagrellus redivivus TaxID=6233 RepID=A0A7E4V7H1_PANRE
MADEKRRYLNEIFPWAAVDRALQDYPNMPNDWLANHIVEKLADFTVDPVLPKVPVVPAAEAGSSNAAPTEPSARNDIGPMIFNDAHHLRAELRKFLKETFKKAMKAFRRRASRKFRKLIKYYFRLIPDQLIDEVFTVTKSRRLATFCLLSLVSTNSRETVEELGIKLENWDQDWLIDSESKFPNHIDWMVEGWTKYKSICQLYEKLKKYADVLIRENMILHPTVTCNVCFEDWFPQFTKPCGDDPNNCHRFCNNCVIAHANAATQNMPMAEFGVGLTCMEFECKNPIYLTKLRNLLPVHIMRRLDERVFEENLGAAGIQVERCHKCNFAIEMEPPKNVNKVFHCPHCGQARCRLCDRPWNNAHFGLTCREIDVREGNAPYWRAVETKLNEAVTRRCHKCNLAFVKSDGCNLMTCRCRSTQCYICRAKNITYNHFCDHPKQPSQTRCTKCTACMLFDDATALDNTVIRNIMKEANESAPTTINNEKEATTV